MLLMTSLQQFLPTTPDLYITNWKKLFRWAGLSEDLVSPKQSPPELQVHRYSFLESRTWVLTAFPVPYLAVHKLLFPHLVQPVQQVHQLCWLSIKNTSKEKSEALKTGEDQRYQLYGKALFSAWTVKHYTPETRTKMCMNRSICLATQNWG